MTLGEKILRLRKARGWSQEELAGRIGVTRQALSRWESEAAMPDTVNVVQIADLFGVSTDYLLRENWVEDRADLPKDGRATEQRIVAWIITALGAAGTLTTLIVGGVLNPNQSSWNPTFEWFLVWTSRNLLWLPILFWAMMVLGIYLLHAEAVNSYLRESLEEMRRILGTEQKIEK